jgi:ABC-type phosphate transport system permease subunit
VIIATLVAGICLLIFGRKLFWLFVGIMGFIYGLGIASQFFAQQPQWVTIAAALCAGILGTVLAIFLQHVIVGVAGFLAGAYLSFDVLNLLGFQTGQTTWIISIVCGILCAALFLNLFDWALILLSSLIGALLIAQTINAGFQVMASVFAACTIAGVAIQASLMKKAEPSEPS